MPRPVQPVPRRDFTFRPIAAATVTRAEASSTVARPEASNTIVTEAEVHREASPTPASPSPPAPASPATMSPGHQEVVNALFAVDSFDSDSLPSFNLSPPGNISYISPNAPERSDSSSEIEDLESDFLTAARVTNQDP